MKTPKLLTALIYWIFLITAGSAYAETPTLTVFTYSSFTSEWGAGTPYQESVRNTMSVQS